MKLTGAITILSLTGSAWAAHQAYEFVYDTTPVGQDAATSYGMAAQTDMSAEPTMVMDQGMMTKSMAYEMPTKAAGMAGAAMHTVRYHPASLSVQH